MHRVALFFGIFLSIVSAQIIHFSENFEGTINWTTSGGGWEFGTPAAGTITVPEGSKCAGTILNGDYINNASYYLYSPSISLPDSPQIRLSFSEYYALESSYDFIYLDIEKDSSNIWTPLRSSTSSSSTNWSQSIINLSSYANSVIRLRFRLTSDESSVRRGWYIDQLQIYTPVIKVLTIRSSGNGSTTPTGNTTLESGSAFPISATPSTGYRFNNWTIQSGTATITSATSQSTSVTISDNATIQANFTPGTIYDVSYTPDTFNFTTHHYEISPSNGVRLRFRAPAAGNYAIAINNSYKRISYFGNDSTFTTSKGTSVNSSTQLLYYFTASTSNENQYFTVYPYSNSYWSSDFSAKVLIPVKLIISRDNKGSSYPAGTVLLWSGVDTLLTAVSNGGYQFSSWSVIEGNATFTSITSASTRVRVQGDSAIIKPVFVINPATKPKIEISDINISSHPDICLTALVTDSTGRSIAGLDSSNFTLTQDNSSVNYQLTQLSEITGVSVTLVIDRSGSMAGSYITDAKEAAKQYVRTMGPLDRSSIVTFESSARVDQTITGDTTRLITAINGISTTGGTYILTGTLKGLQQLTNETNTRALIVFSDGDNFSADIPIQDVIDYARQNNITIYSIGIGQNADRTVLGTIADSTGGYYSYSPTPAGLAQIYAQIKSDIQSQYILCYRSPDEIFNGDTHEVVVSVNLNNHIDLDTVYWNENNQPPLITLSTTTQGMIGVSQTSNQPLTISANVTDDGTIGSVRLFYRTSSNTAGSFTEIPMQHTTGSIYQVIIPAVNIRHPGIDFYILATDNYQMIGRSPNILVPETQPWVIPIDNRVPVISNTQTTCLTQGLDNSISAEIHDSDGVFYAVLYFKKRTETFFTIDTMEEVSPNHYSGTIASGIITAAGIDYYIRAVDDVGAAARYPAIGNDSLYLCQNQNRNPVANAGTDLTIDVITGCSTTVSLDGSLSRDPDGDPITYTWTGPFIGTLTGVLNSKRLPLGLHTVILRVTDNYGLYDMDTLLVSLVDRSVPVPILDTLPVQLAQCSFSAIPPKASDNCTDTIIGLPSGPTAFATQGNHSIHWTFTDANGNSRSQIQHISINDTMRPAPEKVNLDTLTGECSVILSAPYAIDNCSGRIQGITTSMSTISDTGIHQIEWTFEDDVGNIFSQTQYVIIQDVTPPSITAPADTSLVLRAADSACSIIVDSATAHDNCASVKITASRSDGLPLSSVFKKGTTLITWIATDRNGNSDTAVQSISVKINRVPILIAPADTFMAEREIVNFFAISSDSDGFIPYISVLSPPAWLTVNDKRNDSAAINLSPGCSDHGSYKIHFIATDSIDTAFATFNIRIDDINFPPVFDSLPLNRKIREGIAYNLTVNVQDCDGTDPEIRMLTSIPGARFSDNTNSSGIFSWTPDADDYGFYMIIFEATDNNSVVRDTIFIEVTDENVSPPVLNVSTKDTTCSVNLPLVIVVHATDLDGTPPFIKATQLPADAKFTSDANGSGVFSWTPRDTGTVAFFITAYDQFDSTNVSQLITIRINDENVTGPEFEPHPAVTIQQNQDLFLTIRAIDPDGTNPILNLISPPDGTHFIDNGNGEGVITWRAACDISGTFIFKASASDGKFGDTTSIFVEVRDVNCSPILYRLGDINAQFGERLSIPIRSYDPDNNGSTPVLSISCLLPGYSFITQPDGSAQFNWSVIYQSGSYPVTFYATDGNSTDSMTVIISINKKGSLKISVSPKNARIYAFPNDCFKGKYLGKDSVLYTGAPGTSWFEFQAPGCRSQRVAYNIKADSTIRATFNLKPAIPLMVVSPDTLKNGSSKNITQNGSISFADLNGDRIIDLSLATSSGIISYYGIDSTNHLAYSSLPVSYYAGTLESCIHHSFIRWNNNDTLSCIVSTKTGKVLKINLKSNVIDTLISTSGSHLYPTVFDADMDGKKDLIVNNAGVGLFIYYNAGTDSNPVIDYAKECTSPSNSSFTDLNGAPLLLDLDMDGREELLIVSGGILKIFKPDSSFSKLTFKEDLNCGGNRFTADSLSNSLIGSTTGMSRLAVRTGNHILIYPTHLQGDITSDGKVDIRDISKISRNWEITENNQSWDSTVNLKLSDTGIETINIRDITAASKNWELEE